MNQEEKVGEARNAYRSELISMKKLRNAKKHAQRKTRINYECNTSLISMHQSPTFKLQCQ